MKKYIILYGLLLAVFTILTYIFIDANLIYLKNLYTGFIFEYRFLISLVYILLILLFYGFYILFIFKTKRNLISGKDLKILIFTSVSILFFAYPAMLSYDIFNYIATSKVLYFYHENPYLIMPIEFTGDPLLLFMHAANKTALYGPLWIVATGIPFFLGSGNFLITLFSFKLFVIPFYLGLNILIWKFSKNSLPLLLFALNPLVLMETLISGHNDAVMIFFALFSFYLLKKKIFIWSVIFFIFSIFIKYATIFLIPVFIYLFIKSVQGKQIKWEKVFLASFFSMILIFLLSSLREEIYPWYAIWFLPFSFLCYKRKVLFYISLTFSFSLLFRYVPFFLLGTYFGSTPVIKTLLTFIPVALISLYLLTIRLFRGKI